MFFLQDKIRILLISQLKSEIAENLLKVVKIENEKAKQKTKRKHKSVSSASFSAVEVNL